MAMSEETILASRQHNAYQKLKCRPGAGGYGLSAGNCGEGNGLGRYKAEGKTTACKHFSIRGFVARTRDINTKTCWPFPQHLLEIRLKDECDPVLPPLDIPEYRWWNCQKCTSSLNTPAETSVEKEDVNNLLEPSQEYGGNCYCQSSTYKLHSDRSASSVYACQKSVSNDNMQEMYKENQLDHRQLLQCLTIELKPSDENSSAGELISHKKDEQMVTNEITDQTRIESIVPAELGMHNLENLDSGVKKHEALLHSSDFANSKANINVTESFHHVQEEIACAETGQLTLQKSISELQKNTNEKLDSIENKAEMVSDLQKDTDDKIVSIENKGEIVSDVSGPSNSWERFSWNKSIFEEICNIVRGKEMQAATSQILPLDSKTSEAGDSGLDVNKKENVNHAHISYGENICLGQHIFAENQMDKGTITGTTLEPVTVERVELSIDSRDHIHLASEEKKDVTSVNMNGNESSCHAHIKTNFSNQRKDRIIHCTDQAPLEHGNALLLEETEKLKDKESKHKRRSQKKRSIADIIASESFLPESLHKETEQCIRAGIMEENIQRVENCAQFPVQTYNVKRRKEADQRLCRSRVGRNGLPEININNIDTHNIIQDKGRPEKLEVRKKRRGLGAQFWNSNLLHFAKDSLDSCKCDTIRDNSQVPQDASEMWRSSEDKSLGEGSFHLENGESEQKGMQLDDEIPMDIVELMAKNQHERGLSKPVNIYESHNIQTDKSLMKMKGKETDFSHVAKLLDKERVSHKHNSGTANRVAQLGQSNKANPRAYLTSATGIEALGDTSKIAVSQTSPKCPSVNSGIEGIESVSSQSLSSMLQLPQFNPWKTCCSGFATSGFGGINAAHNPPVPVVHSTKPHAVLTHCDHNGYFYMNGRALPAVQCQEATADDRHKQMQNLCREASSALSDMTNPELSKFQNKAKSVVNHHWVSSLLNSQERLIKAENLSKLMSSRNSDLEITGSGFDFLNQYQKEKDVSKQPSRTDPAFCPAFLEGQNKSGVMQQGNVQTPTFGNEHSSSASVLRLMGQRLSVPNGFGNGKNMATGNQDDGSCYKLFQGSLEKHIDWVHAIPCVPSGAVERNEKERLSKADIVFRGSPTARESMHINNQTMNPSQTVPPVPKFRAFEHLVLNGPPQIQGISCTFPIKTNDAVQSSMENTKSPPSSTLLFGIMQDRLQYSNVINAYRNESENPSTLPLIAQITDSVKGFSSSTKGLRSCRRLPTDVRSRRHHRSALDIYLEKRCQRLQSSWASGTTDPNQSSAEEAGKTERDPELILNRENLVSSSCGEKGACNTEICTLNQNPAEINLDDGEENRDIFGYEESSRDVGLAQKVPRKKCSPARAQKHRKTLKIRQLRGFFAQNTDNVVDSINRNEGMATSWNDRSTIQQVCGNSVSGRYVPPK